MKPEQVHLLIEIVVAVLAGYSFGQWQHSAWAGSLIVCLWLLVHRAIKAAKE